jgi:hypothetical protein
MAGLDDYGVRNPGFLIYPPPTWAYEPLLDMARQPRIVVAKLPE